MICVYIQKADFVLSSIALNIASFLIDLWSKLGSLKQQIGDNNTNTASASSSMCLGGARKKWFFEF